jgi:hypothetical protein
MRADQPVDPVVQLEVHDRLGLRRQLPGEAEALGRRYGFTVTSDPAVGKGFRHYFLVWDDPLDPARLDAIMAGLGTRYDTASVAYAYPDAEASAAAVPHIDAVKAATDNRVNVIRPDRQDEHGLYVSTFKLLETMVAETVRIKYRPRKASSDLPGGFRRHVLPFFVEAARRFTDNRLWHRGRSDGCIAVRYEDGLAITATRTSKAPLEPDRIVLVHGYDEETNTVTYSGPALPSADSVELMVLAREVPELRAFTHTHASELITRNPRFEAGVRIGARPYGEATVGHELAGLLRDRTHEVVVIEGHGEIFSSTSDGVDYFRWLDHVCATARDTLGGLR